MKLSTLTLVVCFAAPLLMGQSKMMILHDMGYAYARPSWIVQNLSYVDSTSFPFDGVAMRPEEEGASPYIESALFQPSAVSVAQIQNAMSALTGVTFQNLKHNMGLVYFGSGWADAYNDSQWAIVAQNLANYATALKSFGIFDGIAFDNENYGTGNYGNYGTSMCASPHTLDQCQAQMMARGNQVMRAIQNAWPGAVVLFFRGNGISDYTGYQLAAANVNSGINNISQANTLVGPFETGFVQAVSQLGHGMAVDGGEDWLYNVYQASQYQWIYNRQKHGISDDSLVNSNCSASVSCATGTYGFIPSDMREPGGSSIWAGAVTAGEECYLWDWIDHSTYQLSGSTNGLPNLQLCVQNAMSTSDKYSWMYVEASTGHSLLAQPASQTWAYSQSVVNAIAAGRAAALRSSTDFSITGSSAGNSVTQAGTETYTITITPQSGFTGNVGLTINGLPPGASSSFTPSTVNGGSGTSTLSVMTNASTTPVGSYTLNVTGTSGSLTHTALLTLVVSAAGRSGSLSGNLTHPTGNVNLTTAGTADWAHWGYNGSRMDHKASGGGRISNITPIPTGGTVNQTVDYGQGFYWNDGTPTVSIVSGSATKTGVWIFGNGHGFSITAPADTQQRTLSVYVGVWNATGNMTASLSDSSAPSYNDTSMVATDPAVIGMYTFTYHAASPGQTLTITWTASNATSNIGNVSIEAAALAAPLGSLTGNVGAPVGPINLTSAGSSDWVHWGYGSAPGVDHKASGSSQISNYTAIGTGYIGQYTDNLFGYTWTDGSPDTSITSTTTGVYVYGQGNGFQITAPADTTPRTLKVYVGVYGAQGTMIAHLTDGSAVDYTDASILAGSGAHNNGVYTFTYHAASPGQKLLVTWTQASATDGNVTLQGAALAPAVQ